MTLLGSRLFHCSSNEITFYNCFKNLNDELDKLETTPIHYSQSQTKTNQEIIKYSPYLNRANFLKFQWEQYQIKNAKTPVNTLLTFVCKRSMNLFRSIFFLPKAVEKDSFAAYRTLNRKIIALQYRLEAVNGGVSQEPATSQHIAKLEERALKWKQGQLFLDKKLTEKDKRMIEEVCTYPRFAELLHDDVGLVDEFFKWAIRDQLPVAHFVQFPSTVARLKKTFMASRLSRLGVDLLILQKETVQGDAGDQQKVVKLPFYNNENKTVLVNILDETQTLTLNGNRTATIREIFDECVKKKKTCGTFEFFGKGIMNWHVMEQGVQNVDQIVRSVVVQGFRWWQRLPTFEVLTKEAVESKYAISLAEGQWVAAALATRESKQLSASGTHAFLEVAIPQEDGTYILYPFGKYPEHYPNTILGKLVYLIIRSRAKIMYPDHSVFFSHRQFAAVPFVIDEKQGLQLMGRIQKELEISQSGTGEFQVRSENCSDWVQDLLGSIDGLDVPKLYQCVFSFPDMLHKKIESGEVKGVIS